MAWDLGVYTGKVYGLALWTQSYAILYNKAHFREAGLDPTRGPQTLDELATFAEKLTKRDPAAPGGYARLGFYEDSFTRWIPVFGGQLLDGAGKKVTANHPGTLKALEWLAGMWKRYDADRIIAFRDSLGTLPGGPFGGEKYSMSVNGPWGVRTLKEQAPQLDYGVAYLPSPPDQPGLGCFTYGDVPVVPAGAKHAAGAWQLVQFLTRFGTFAVRPIGARRVRALRGPQAGQLLTVPAHRRAGFRAGTELARAVNPPPPAPARRTRRAAPPAATAGTAAGGTAARPPRRRR